MLRTRRVRETTNLTHSGALLSRLLRQDAATASPHVHRSAHRPSGAAGQEDRCTVRR